MIIPQRKRVVLLQMKCVCCRACLRLPGHPVVPAATIPVEMQRGSVEEPAQAASAGCGHDAGHLSANRCTRGTQARGRACCFGRCGMKKQVTLWLSDTRALPGIGPSRRSRAKRRSLSCRPPLSCHSSALTVTSVRASHPLQSTRPGERPTMKAEVTFTPWLYKR